MFGGATPPCLRPGELVDAGQSEVELAVGMALGVERHLAGGAGAGRAAVDAQQRDLENAARGRPIPEPFVEWLGRKVRQAGDGALELDLRRLGTAQIAIDRRQIRRIDPGDEVIASGRGLRSFGSARMGLEPSRRDQGLRRAIDRLRDGQSVGHQGDALGPAEGEGEARLGALPRSARPARAPPIGVIVSGPAASAMTRIGS